MGLILRPATMRDAGLLYTWRQEGEHADWWDGDPVDRETHERWLSMRLHDPLVRIWIGDHDDQPVGVVRIDSNGELSIEIGQKHQGEGHGTRMTAAACHLARQQLGHSRIKACVDQTNIAARVAFQNAGFEHRQDVCFYLWKP